MTRPLRNLLFTGCVIFVVSACATDLEFPEALGVDEDDVAAPQQETADDEDDDTGEAGAGSEPSANDQGTEDDPTGDAAVDDEATGDEATGDDASSDLDGGVDDSSEPGTDDSPGASSVEAGADETDDTLADDTVDDSAVDDSAVDDSAVDDSAVDDGALDEPPADDMPTDLEAGVDPSADDTSADDAVVDDPILDAGDGSPTDAPPPEAPAVLRVLEIDPVPKTNGVSIDTDITARFNRDLVAGTGTIDIVDLDTSQTVYSLPLDDAQVQLSGDTIRIDLDDLLLGDTQYAVEIGPDVVTDAEGALFDGVVGSTWTFTTETADPPGGVGMADVVLWLDAQLGGGFKYSGDGAIRLWADRSPNHYHFAQTRSGEGPALTAGALNGVDAVTFDGSSWLEGPDIADPNEYDLFVVWQSPITASTSELSFIFANGVREGVNAQFTHGHSVAAYVSAAITFVDDDYEPASFDTPAANTAYLWNASLSAGTLSSRTNGTLSNSVTGIISAPASTIEPATIGGFESDFFFEGEIGEVLMFSRALSAAERTAVEAYFSARWNVP